ncbi:MAG: hypothetical protein ACLTYN_17045 [Dysosmobacter welbionis]
MTAGADNGVTAKTLIPTDPSGYTVCGKSTSETPPNIPSPTRSC